MHSCGSLWGLMGLLIEMKTGLHPESNFVGLWDEAGSLLLLCCILYIIYLYILHHFTESILYSILPFDSLSWFFLLFHLLQLLIKLFLFDLPPAEFVSFLEGDSKIRQLKCPSSSLTELQ